MNDKVTNLLGGKRRMVWFAIVLLVIAGGLSWLIFRSREPMPMYEGKPLSYWLECYAPLNRTETSVQQADHALQAIGTNAVPTLVRMLQKHDSSLDVRLRALLAKQSFFHPNWHPAEYYQLLAWHGFLKLGSDGYPAVPKLIKLYQGTTNEDFKHLTLQTLGNMGPTAKNAVPFLASLLPDSKNRMRFTACWTLGKIHANPESAIPALTNCLNDTSPVMRRLAANTLISYRSDARPAVPALLNLFEDKDAAVRQAAKDALAEIDPQTASQFEANEKSAH